MILATDLRNGINIELNGEVFSVIWFQHHKPGKGGAMVRTKLKNIATGRIMEKTFRPEDRFEKAVLERTKNQYLYRDGKNYYFMDMETFEQIPFTEKELGEGTQFLKENMEVGVLIHKGAIIGVEMPNSVELRVAYTEPGKKGDTVTNVTKPAVVETGAKVQVPLFINTGDTIKVDTQTGKYIERV
ncbi:MAG: elongation factor P [bacterium]